MDNHKPTPHHQQKITTPQVTPTLPNEIPLKYKSPPAPPQTPPQPNHRGNGTGELTTAPPILFTKTQNPLLLLIQ